MMKTYYSDQDQLTKKEKVAVALYLFGITTILAVVTGSFIGICLKEKMRDELKELQKNQPTVTVEYFTD